MSQPKISHEVPRCLLTASPEFNDYDYCLPHLLDIDEEYKQYFINARDKGRYVIMDNSLHELGEAYNSKRLLHSFSIALFNFRAFSATNSATRSSMSPSAWPMRTD